MTPRATSKRSRSTAGRTDTPRANTLYDPDWSDEELPWVVGRRRFGRIAIANSDAAAICLTQAAFDQGRRAVQEIVTDVVRPQFLYPYSERV